MESAVALDSPPAACLRSSSLEQTLLSSGVRKSRGGPLPLGSADCGHGWTYTVLARSSIYGNARAWVMPVAGASLPIDFLGGGNAG